MKTIHTPTPDENEDFQGLKDSFERVLGIDDCVKRSQTIIVEAKVLNIPPERYVEELANYLNLHTEKASLNLALLKPVKMADAKMSDFVAWLENISLIKLAAVLGEGALLFALVSYIVAIPQRREALIRENRQIIVDQAEQSHSTGRVNALQSLNKFCSNISGIQAPSAQMPGIELINCYQFQGIKALKEFPWQFFLYLGANLNYSNLAGANLAGANLEGVNLRGANLIGADLRSVNLKGADLTAANLTKARLGVSNLEGATLENAILDGASISGSNLKGVNLSHTSLVETQVLWSDLRDTNFYRANLTSANLNRSNLAGADLYKANLQDSSLRFVNLQKSTNLRNTNLKGADLSKAHFASVNQLQRADNWQSAITTPNWQNKTKLNLLPRLQIGLIRSSQGTIFQAYELGMRRSANRRVEIWGIQSNPGVESEAKTIQKLIDFGIDAIVLRPEDPMLSIPALQAARDAGIVLITIDFCFDEDVATGMVFACYNTDSFQMGYDSGMYLAEWAQKNLADGEAKVGLLDSAKYDRYYPNFQGFLAAMEDSKLDWQAVASTDAVFRAEVDKVVQMLKDNPEINILWGGSNSATEIALEAVQTLGLQKKVAVFGILDLSRQKAQMLLDPDSPLQSIIDQSGVEIGEEAVKTAITWLRGEAELKYKYEFYPIKHRLLTQEDKDAVRDLLREVSGIR